MTGEENSKQEMWKTRKEKTDIRKTGSVIHIQKDQGQARCIMKHKEEVRVQSLDELILEKKNLPFIPSGLCHDGSGATSLI